MIEFFGAISITVALGTIIAVFWRRRTFLGTKNITEYGVSLPGQGVQNPVFTGAANVFRAHSDAVDLAEALLDTPIEKTTAWREP